MGDQKHRKVICALDTSDLDLAIAAVKRLAPYVGGFKVGHGLALPHGLGVLDTLRDAGANRIFLDLKFHDIPNSVALAVREAVKHGVWMITLHTVGGPAMMTAAVEEANVADERERPLLLGVSVLTSVDQHMLSDHIGCSRSVEEQLVYLSKLAVDCGIDGVVCSPEEVKAVRDTIHREGVIVTPGIRRADQNQHDQVRVGTALGALQDGADYLVIGRNLMNASDPVAELAAFGLIDAAGQR